jgi:hypothetical protein
MLDLIGEAYSVLGNSQTRRRYDENRTKSFSVKFGHSHEERSAGGSGRYRKGVLGAEFFNPRNSTSEEEAELESIQEHIPDSAPEPAPKSTPSAEDDIQKEKANLRHYLGEEEPEEHFITGLQHFHASEYEEAMRQFQIALVKDARFTAAKYFLARSMMQVPNHSRHRALALMKEAIRENPKIGNFSLEEKTEHFQMEMERERKRGLFN